jgi:hypothetical protein
MSIRATPSRRRTARRVHLAAHPLPHKAGALKAPAAARLLQSRYPMPVSPNARIAARMHAGTASPAAVLALQRALGNTAVRRMLSARSRCRRIAQPGTRLGMLNCDSVDDRLSAAADP